jgi:excisionase family DNA binding protein
MSTLTLQQAAALLKIHPITLQAKARAGEIPGAKIGKRWVFVEIDLIEYLRAQYRRRALQGDATEVLLCHSTDAQTRLIGGSNSATTDDEYSKVLALPTS